MPKIWTLIVQYQMIRLFECISGILIAHFGYHFFTIGIQVWISHENSCLIRTAISISKLNIRQREYFLQLNTGLPQYSDSYCTGHLLKHG